ncbi:subtilisin-like serine peptidase [Trypanosoma theileri]|uniref:Subtilisin-like serine peptidase n=1 Tax=Trypanosoma theileri TaxID=67003 RepID=A0A1X0NMV8_9TRYP|nr:subtilisin-like serine peptidase [Trypanosoma theileri]ORC85469.1 subtilisin-like serine peptidase [Trypanosoma theileri]
MLVLAILPRRLYARSCCNAVNIMCRSHTSVAWYSTGKKEKKRTSSRDARRRHSKSKDESSTSSTTNITASAVSEEETANVPRMTVDRPTIVAKPRQQGEKITMVLPSLPSPSPSPSLSLSSSSSSSSSVHWSPTERDYEALVADLLLYRCESLEPVLDALRKERALFDESIRRMEERIADMYLLREEIREMLKEGAAEQHRTLTNALQSVSDCNIEKKEGKVASPHDASEEDVDVEISL